MPIDPADWLGIAITSPDMNDVWSGDRGVRFWTPSKPYKDGIVEEYVMRRQVERLRASNESDAIVKGIEEGTLTYTRPCKPCKGKRHGNGGPH